MSAETNQTFEAIGKVMHNLEDLHLDNSTESNTSKLFRRNWAHFSMAFMTVATPGLGILVGYAPMVCSLSIIIDRLT